MRFRTRFQLSLATTAALVLAMGGLAAWSLVEARRAAEWSDWTGRLQRQVLERSVVRDEYLLYREPRARRQYEERSVALREALGRIDGRLGAEERQIAVGMLHAVERTQALFGRLVALPDERERSGEDREALLAQRGQLVSGLVLLGYDLSTGAAYLADRAAAREQATRRISFLLGLGVMAGVLAVTLVNAAFAGGLLQSRIRRLQEGTARIAGGDLSARLGMRGDDELAELARNFDEMARRLEEGHGALRREVADRRLANARLEAANQELEAFSYSVSHDLRAPLRHMAGFVDLLVRHAGDGLDDKARHYLEVIAGAARRMGALIDDLLAFSRVGRVELRPVRTGLRPLLDEAVHELSGELDGRAVRWEIGPLPEVQGDPALLRQVWANLVSNAVKFSRQRDPARIEIGGKVVEGEVRCWVRDNGVGFDMRHADKLFGVFQRLHPQDAFEGTGVGLANVKRIVVRHGGRVWAEASPGQGATFWFSIPCAEEGT